jgi:hypothetical protein
MSPRRSAVLSSVVLALASTAACGGAIAPSSQETPTPEGGSAAPPGQQPEAGAPDPDASLDPSAGDVYGITDDGFVVYRDGTSVKAVSIEGGLPMTVMRAESGLAPLRVTVQGTSAQVWMAFTGNGATGQDFYWASLSVWSHARGATTIDTYAPGIFRGIVGASKAAISPDGGSVAYLHPVVPAGGAGDVTWAIDIAEIGGPATTLASALAAGWLDPPATLTFTPNGALFATYAPNALVAGRAGQIVASLFTFGARAPAQVAVGSVAVGQWSYAVVDPTGSWAALGDGASTAKLVSLATLEQWDLPQGFTGVQFDITGATLFGRTPQSIVRVDTSAPTTPVTLETVSSPSAVRASPDGSHLTYVSNAPTGTFATGSSVLYLASASRPGDAVVLASGPSVSTEAFFTADSAYLAFLQSGWQVAPVAAAATDVQLGGGTVVPLGGSRVLDNVPTLSVVDLSGSTPTRALCQDCGGNFALSGDRAHVAYIGHGGLYVAATE